MMQSNPDRSEGFDVIIRPAPSGAGRTTASQPSHYPLNAFVIVLIDLPLLGFIVCIKYNLKYYGL